MPTLVLINPVAGQGKSKHGLDERIAARFKREGEGFEIAFPTDIASWHKQVAEAGKSGYDKILAVGGDGTVHQTIQALDFDNVALGILPAGSGNDIYRMFGIPPSIDAALDNFFAGESRIDLGLANGLNFLNTAGLGLDSMTLQVRQESHGWRARNYVYLFLITLHKLKQFDFRIEVDGTSYNERAYWVIAANSGFIGGGMKVAPDASAQDGLFDLMIMGGMPKYQLIMMLPEIFKGTHIKHPGVKQMRGRHIVISCDEDIPCAVDGEIHGRPPMDVTIIPGKVRICGKLNR